ncbi:MAG TPA: hypothetical protein PK167_13270, partial [Prolixibacteraceae bacterium]|nr:hypothetical protein [Prolixibacteraceae bacterium]
ALKKNYPAIRLAAKFQTISKKKLRSCQKLSSPNFNQLISTINQFGALSISRGFFSRLFFKKAYFRARQLKLIFTGQKQQKRGVIFSKQIQKFIDQS